MFTNPVTNNVHITFANGVDVSLLWRQHSYSSNRNNVEGDNQASATCGVYVRGLTEAEDKRLGCDGSGIYGYASANQAARLMYDASHLPTRAAASLPA